MNRFSDTTIRARNESAWLVPDGDDRTNHRLRADMRRFADDDEVDIVIVGCGAGGATLMQRLARAGWRVVGLDAGPFWDPDADWVSDEAGSHRLYWTEPRVITGADPVPSGRTTPGGGSVGPWSTTPATPPASTPPTSTPRRPTESAPTGRSPIRTSAATTKRSKRNCRSRGRTGRGAIPTPTGTRPSLSAGTARSSCGARRRSASRPGSGPVAIANGRFGNRPHCIYRGFCLQGCKVNAKASPLITHVPDALAHGAEIRANCMVSRVEIGDSGLATGVTYFTGGVEHFQRARMVAVAGYSIETPACCCCPRSKRFPDGLCNDEGQVGRYVMVQGAPQTAGRFEDEIRMFKAPPPEVSSEHYYETDPTKDYRRGFSIQNVSPLPITWAEHVAAQGHWGEVLREYMRDYVHWATLGALCEFLPQYDNAVTLAEETDRHGLPVAKFSYSQCDNDTMLMKAARGVMEDLLKAAGAEEVITIDRYAHLVGGCRMAASPKDGVVDANLPQLRRPQPLYHRRQRAAHPGLRQPGVDDHGPRRTLCRPPHH